MADYVAEAIAGIRSAVGSDEVILGLSGGVDSSVAAALIHRAIGDQLTCVFVDHGLLRLNEAEQVMDTFARNLGVQVIHVDATDEIHAAARRRRGSGGQAQDHWRLNSSTVFKQRGSKTDQRRRQRSQVARSGHDLSRRHRVRRRQDQEGAHDQVAPQRRRTARDAAPEAARAAARVVQGRGARAGPGTRAPARHPLAPPLPRPRARRADPGRGQARARRPAAPRRRDLHRRAARGRALPVRHPAGLRRVPAGALGRRDGRRPDLRLRGRAARGADDRTS